MGFAITKLLLLILLVGVSLSSTNPLEPFPDSLHPVNTNLNEVRETAAWALEQIDWKTKNQRRYVRSREYANVQEVRGTLFHIRMIVCNENSFYKEKCEECTIAVLKQAYGAMILTYYNCDSNKSHFGKLENIRQSSGDLCDKHPGPPEEDTTIFSVHN